MKKMLINYEGYSLWLEWAAIFFANDILNK